ncbi:MAG: M20/M25/M40 family metallo-hydrolase [Betaproteobacteria bacterium]|nr:M20/M25/M40 family metallo-hydrolase [Betaproteobacteria bacterium]
MNARIPVLESTQLLTDVSRSWDDDIVHRLHEYVEVPAKSPSFDPQWAQHGWLHRVLHAAADWVRAQQVPGLQLEIIELPGRTPVLFFEVPATRAASEGSQQTVLMYGHLDKQPEFNGWRSDLGPWTPKYQDGLLYGRGAADDGYAVYASVAAIQALQRQQVPHPRIVGLIETGEESGSPDLIPYIDALRVRMGDVGLVICLDSGAGNYDQLWLTTSLRGLASGVLKVEILTEGVHSGDASGLVPSSFRIMRQPTLSVTGAEGFPSLQDAGNVLRPYTAFKLSLRLPPLVDAAAAVAELKTLLEDNAPYQANVTFHAEGAASGWNAPATAPWFEQALNQASLAHFGAPVGHIGQGGTIPLMNLLSQGFPSAQMMVCGVLGPKSNAHGPNEFLHVPYARRLTAAVAQVIAQMP